MSMIYVAIRNDTMDFESSEYSLLGVFDTEASAIQCCDTDLDTVDPEMNGYDQISYFIEPMMLNGSVKLPVINYVSIRKDEGEAFMSELDELLAESYEDTYLPSCAGGGKASRFSPTLH
jgi:hypothetical protein